MDDTTTVNDDPASASLRPRGGGAIFEQALAVEDMLELVKVDDYATESKGFLKPLDPTASCVPAGFEWVTQMKPPPRLKRNKRKSEDGDTTMGEATSDASTPATNPGNPRAVRSTRRPSRTNAPLPRPLASLDTKSFGVSQLAPLAPVPPRQQPHSRSAARKQPKPAAEPASSEAIQDEGVDPTMPAATPDEFHTGKRARHNQTERQRVDRLNRLFQKVNVTLDDPEADDLEEIGKLAEEKALVVAASESTNKVDQLGGRSKAEVLEGALQTITQLRRMLKEERLARCLDAITGTDTELDGIGIDANSIDEAAAAMNIGESAETIDQSEGHGIKVEADKYENVSWNAEDEMGLVD
uniref:BHLH domain-containing protein n=1 Tax=Haptolina brevifila TaxID=156173 RepID=A0A7S2DJ27_9EUKA